MLVVVNNQHSSFFGSVSYYHPNRTNLTVCWLFTGAGSITGAGINWGFILSVLIIIVLTPNPLTKRQEVVSHDPWSGLTI
jgi:hypothetical protein